MELYDPLIPPDPNEWLALDEAERISLVQDFHRRARIELPNESVHAALQATVETQVAMGDKIPVGRTLDRLMAEGLDRHEGLHAIGMQLVDMMHDVVQAAEPKGDPNAAYFAALERLTADGWRNFWDEPGSEDREAEQEFEEDLGIEEILDALNAPDILPVEAIRAAERQRDVVAPALIEIVKGYIATKPRPAVEGALFFIFHMLGSWRETAAYRPLAKLLTLPRDEVHPVLDGAVTDTTHRVMAAVFDGDPQPLYDLVLAEQADEFIRSRMCETIAMLALRGQLPRPEAARFLQACYSDIRPQDECFVWHGWQSAIAMLGLSELRPLVEQAFARAFISPAWLDFKDFDEDLQLGTSGKIRLEAQDEYELFGDTIAELSTWAALRDDTQSDDGDWDEDAELWNEPALPAVPYVNPHRDVGRNDPCPCGSGKKYKKCCLDKEQQPS